MRRKVIAFCGVEKSGKDYSCQRLLMTKGFTKLAFADPLRDIAFHILGMPFEEGMKEYEELKKTDIYKGLNFRNILENLGSAVRKYDKDFWARTVIKGISETVKDVCISDMRYPNEYKVLKAYCDEHGIDFKVVFCNYKSPDYRADNPHESAGLANYLIKLGYQDQEYVDGNDILAYEAMREGKDGKERGNAVQKV